MERTDWSSMITGIAIGLGVGAALGLLFAPQSGEDTRGYLAGAARQKFNDTKERFSDVTDRVRDVKDRFNNVVESGKEFARTAQDSVEGVKSHLQDLADAGQRAYRDAAKA
jgi:gas vesicle protein